MSERRARVVELYVPQDLWRELDALYQGWKARGDPMLPGVGSIRDMMIQLLRQALRSLEEDARCR